MSEQEIKDAFEQIHHDFGEDCKLGVTAALNLEAEIQRLQSTLATMQSESHRLITNLESTLALREEELVDEKALCLATERSLQLALNDREGLRDKLAAKKQMTGPEDAAEQFQRCPMCGQLELKELQAELAAKDSALASAQQALRYIAKMKPPPIGYDITDVMALQRIAQRALDTTPQVQPSEEEL